MRTFPCISEAVRKRSGERGELESSGGGDEGTKGDCLSSDSDGAALRDGRCFITVFLFFPPTMTSSRAS